MMWRLLMRRVPMRSMTLVGDVAQTGSAAGARSWGEVLEPYVEGRWRLEELTVNYRTPAQVMALAAAVLRGARASSATPPSRSARATGRRRRAGSCTRRASTRSRAARSATRSPQLAVLGGGRLGGDPPPVRRRALRRALVRAPGRRAPSAPAGRRSTARCRCWPWPTAKGLEFDARRARRARATSSTGSPRGANDLYVALTRPTQRLLVLHTADLPAGMDALESLAD